MGSLHPVDTHDWEMKRSVNNVLGEPTYISVCTRCGLTPGSVAMTNQRCEDHDGSSDDYLPRSSKGEHGGPDPVAA